MRTNSVRSDHTGTFTRRIPAWVVRDSAPQLVACGFFSHPPLFVCLASFPGQNSTWSFLQCINDDYLSCPKCFTVFANRRKLGQLSYSSGKYDNTPVWRPVTKCTSTPPPPHSCWPITASPEPCIKVGEGGRPTSTD